MNRLHILLTLVSLVNLGVSEAIAKYIMDMNIVRRYNGKPLENLNQNIDKNMEKHRHQNNRRVLWGYFTIRNIHRYKHFWLFASINGLLWFLFLEIHGGMLNL